MTRSDREANLAYNIIGQMATLIRLRDYRGAERPADRARRDRQNRVYDRTRGRRSRSPGRQSGVPCIGAGYEPANIAVQRTVARVARHGR